MLGPGGVVAISSASAGGRLFDFGEYPGMRVSLSGNGHVLGEVVEFQDLESIFETLDQEEGAEFRREVIDVHVNGSIVTQAWCYLLVYEPTDQPVIPSGSWHGCGS